MGNSYSRLRTGWNRRGPSNSDVLAQSYQAAREKQMTAIREALWDLDDVIGIDARQAWFEQTVADNDSPEEIVRKTRQHIAYLQDSTGSAQADNSEASR